MADVAAVETPSVDEESATDSSERGPAYEPLDRGAPASWPARLGAVETVLLALVVAGDVVDHLPISLLLAAAFVGGVLLGCLPLAGRLFRWTTGWVIGSLAMGALFVVIALSRALLGTSRELFILVPLAGLVPIGADWRWAPRLRDWILVSGVLVVVVLGISVDTFDGIHRGRAILAAAAWLALALTSLRLLRHDLAVAVPRPSPATGAEARARPRGLLDVGLLVLASLLAAAYLVVLAGSLECGLHHATCAERAERARPEAVTEDEGAAVPTTHPVPTLFPQAEHASENDPPWLAIFVGIAVAALLVLGAVVWWARRRGRAERLHLGPDGIRFRPMSKWGEQMAFVIMAIGSQQGRPRLPAEPLAAYAEALAALPGVDQRVGEAGAIVSRALFGPGEPPIEQRAWAERILTALWSPVPAAPRVI